MKNSHNSAGFWIFFLIGALLSLAATGLVLTVVIKLVLYIWTHY